jgi:hypothetical protein
MQIVFIGGSSYGFGQSYGCEHPLPLVTREVFLGGNVAASRWFDFMKGSQVSRTFRDLVPRKRQHSCGCSN